MVLEFVLAVEEELKSFLMDDSRMGGEEIGKAEEGGGGKWWWKGGRGRRKWA